MSSQIKIKVLGVGAVETGKGESGRQWYRRILQIWTGEVAGNHPYYAEEADLKDLSVGDYMTTVAPRAGNRGKLEFVISGLMPVQKGGQPT